MKRVSQRTCLGCFKKQPKNKLRRLVVKNERLMVDLTGQAPGRGAYVCQKGRGINQACFKLAQEKNAFAKAFKKKIDFTRLIDE